ncbi:MAG: sugar phosphate nucleotidyltransferase [Candidatus Gastranaerophilaceae bacterium]
MYKAMVMSAGVGSRLDPLTKSVPKPLVPIANKPVMDILLENLKAIGVKDVVANTFYLAEQIVAKYIENDLGINFNYITEETLSGTAGGVKKCQFFFEEGDDFFVLSADGVTNADLMKGMDIHKKSGAIATIGVKSVPEEDIPNFGVVVTNSDGYIVEFQEKPAIKDAKSNLVNTGIYIFNYKIFDYIPANEFYDFAKNVFPKLLQDRQINVFPVEEYWSDIGTLDQYKQSTFDLFENLYTFKHDKISKTETGDYICGQSHVSKSVKFIGHSVIGDDCFIGKNVTLENCILWDGVEIKDGVHLKDCVIASNSRVERNLTNHIIGQNELIVKFKSKHKRRIQLLRFWKKLFGKK